MAADTGAGRVNRALPGGRRPLPGAALVLLILVFGGSVFADVYLPYVRTTGNYQIRTDVSDEFAALIARHMEAIYSEYRLRFPGYERGQVERFTIKVFNRRRDYDGSLPASVHGTAGVFISDQKLLAAFSEGRTQEEVLRTLYHEGFHQFLYEHIGADVPLWVNEGFAEFFAEATWDGRSFRTGQRPWQRLLVLHEAIKSESYIPLEDLFMVESDEWLAAVRADNTLANLQYSQAWSVVHFLVATRPRRDRLLSYLRSVADGRSRADAFEESFGSDIGMIEKMWKEYVMSLTPDGISECRKDMELVLFLAASACDHPSEMESIEGFIRDVFRNERVRWNFTAPDGERVTSDDSARHRRMLRCPDDRGDGVSSYILFHEQRSGLPELYCLHHEGVVIKAYLVRDGETWQPRSEVIVRGTLPEALLRRLERKHRRRR